MTLCPEAVCLETGSGFDGARAAVSSSDGASSMAALKTLREAGVCLAGCRGPLEGAT